jgi:hypothetical protein
MDDERAVAKLTVRLLSRDDLSDIDFPYPIISTCDNQLLCSNFVKSEQIFY